MNDKDNKLMKRLCFILLTLGLVSCNTYIQVATLHSDTVQLNEQGEFFFENEVARIEYFFNQQENGLFMFTIKNLTDEVIYVDMAKSYFINNGIATDYYGRSTTVTVGVANSYSYTNKLNSMVTTTDTTTGIASVSETKTAANFIGIPRGCARIFTGFKVSDSRYIERGFIEDVTGQDVEERNFNIHDSPLVIINYITIIAGGQEIEVENKMYTSKYVNAVDYIKASYRPYSEFMGNNQFYILYQYQDLLLY